MIYWNINEFYFLFFFIIEQLKYYNQLINLSI